MSPDDPTLAYRVTLLEQSAAVNDQRVGRAMEVAARHEEQINGDRGLSRGLADLANEIKSLRKTLQYVGVSTLMATIAFALTVAGAHL